MSAFDCPRTSTKLTIRQMNPLLASDKDLESSSISALENYSNDDGYRSWLPALTAHLERCAAVNEEEFCSEGFQSVLWNSDAVSANGQGNIDVSRVIVNEEIVQALWQFKCTELPEQKTERLHFLISVWEQCLKQVVPLVKRTPLLKMYRVFAALKPSEFTTVAHDSKLRGLARAMGIPVTGTTHPIELHRSVLDRLDQVLGKSLPPPHPDGVKRMTLPWLLYASQEKQRGEEATTIMGAQAGSEQLVPLPPERRRRGMLAIGGYLPSIRSMIEFAKDGCTRDDFKEHIRSINPRLSGQSINMNINALIGEWGVLHAAGDGLKLTQRGEAFLQTGNPEEVSDWLLTRILGFDNILCILKSTPATSSELISLLQEINPGWTSSYAPSALLGWLRSLGLVELDKGKNLVLTEDGKTWATRIHWVPGRLPSAIAKESVPNNDVGSASISEEITRPPLQRVIDSISSVGMFSPSLVARLDAGVWHNPRRHFAVLTGLSGAGKTLLARSYAKALWLDANQPEQGLFTLPVQPGWHDPSSVLGYINPLADNRYVRTGVLDFILRASGDSKRPYTVVLDEMNLSHPEQYLAPILSAMETGDDIQLHTFDEEVNGVPPYIPYPSNLVLIGTVNMDETTHGLSDKILDRASVIEFWNVDVAAYPGWQVSSLSAETLSKTRGILTDLCAALRPVRLHFGWRVIGDVIGYMESARFSGVLDTIAALDHALFAKVLPKLRGEDTPRLRNAFSATAAILKDAGLRECAAKMDDMIDDLKHIGTARFWR